MTQHWNQYEFILFCSVMGYWEFYFRNPDGTIKLIKSKKLRGFGRARAFAKKLYQKGW